MLAWGDEVLLVTWTLVVQAFVMLHRRMNVDLETLKGPCFLLSDGEYFNSLQGISAF